jgi:peptidyl-prolyl cis-trans isomerase SurA
MVPPALAAIQPLDHVIAVVNDEVITRNELDRRAQEVIDLMKTRNQTPPPRAVLEKQLIERMVTELALQQHARSTGIRVDAAQIERTVQRIAMQNNLDLPALSDMLAREGQSLERMREGIRNEILITRARERDVDNRVAISDAEVDGFLQTQAQAGGTDTEVNFGHILITVPENATPVQIRARRARAQDVLDALARGTDFAEVSVAMSDAPNALQGGGSGWRNINQVPTLFVDALKPLAAGAVAPIVRSSNGFHILKLFDKRGLDVAMTVNQTHVRHILVKTNEVTSEADARGRLVQLKERIDNGTAFDELARLHSEDASSSKGGDLGWVNPGDTVPEFERAMDALKPGEVSAPIQSPFGWHLLQVLERRTQDVTAERQKLLAKKALRERKAEEAYQDWVRQIRDSAYVELRLDK